MSLTFVQLDPIRTMSDTKWKINYKIWSAQAMFYICYIESTNYLKKVTKTNINS